MISEKLRFSLFLILALGLYWSTFKLAESNPADVHTELSFFYVLIMVIVGGICAYSLFSLANTYQQLKSASDAKRKREEENLNKQDLSKILEKLESMASPIGTKKVAPQIPVLTDISGIGKNRSTVLNSLKINTLEDLIELDEESIRSVAEFTRLKPATIRGWVKQARAIKNNVDA